MAMRMHRWEMRAPNEPLVKVECALPVLGEDEVLVRVAGCGICHTDLGFLFGGVRLRRTLPLTLGHEVSGVVEDAGAAARVWLHRAVVVQAVIPCGTCRACKRGRSNICPQQIFPGNDIHGGFASHLIVPARGLCPVPLQGTPQRGFGQRNVPLCDLAVLADAITTPYEAVRRSQLAPGEVAIFVGVGGVGGFGVQIARALGAHVVAIDVDPERLELARRYGAELALDAHATDALKIRDVVRERLKNDRLPLTEWKIFETSGTRDGQETAFRLLVPGAHLGIVGFTLESVGVRLSNLMAFDARAEGNWGCPPERYPEALALVESGQVEIAPFVERRSLGDVNTALTDLRAHRTTRRIVLIPEADRNSKTSEGVGESIAAQQRRGA
jgi:6-hydroxycyclohex-1-ene-1-carbonyl-CoA dehydrogenase